jgi:hypothetical protein
VFRFFSYRECILHSYVTLLTFVRAHGPRARVCLSAIVTSELTRELMKTDIVMPLQVSPIFFYFSSNSRQENVASFHRFSLFLGERALFFYFGSFMFVLQFLSPYCRSVVCCWGTEVHSYINI